MTPFTKRITSEILLSYPEWESRAIFESYKGSEPYLIICISAPPEAKTDRPFRISTWDDEVTVDFDYYHCHFEKWLPEEDDERNQAALLYVKDLFAERFAVASWWKGNKMRMSALHKPGEILNKPLPLIRFNRIRVRSWKGTLNEDMEF